MTQSYQSSSKPIIGLIITKTGENLRTSVVDYETTNAFGSLLKAWRKRRGISQLTLALDADVSAKHLSFLENGRSMPSKPMVRRLCACLQLPTDASKQLLEAAGYAQSPFATQLDKGAMARLREAAAWTVEHHMPYPAMALNYDWTIVEKNHTATKMFDRRGLEDDDFLNFISDIEKSKATLENWEEILQAVLRMLRARRKNPRDRHHHAVDNTIARIEQALPTAPSSVQQGDSPPVMRTRWKVGDQTFCFFAIPTMFITDDFLLHQELTVVQYFPVDDACRDLFLTLAQKDGG